MKSLLIRAMCSRPVGRIISAVTRNKIPNSGVRIDLTHPDIPAPIRTAVFWRLYERAEIRLIRTHLDPNLDVVELGSGLGVTGAHILSRLSKNRRLIAVEANELLIQPLKSVLQDRRATLVHAALAYGDGQRRYFHIDPARHLWSRLDPLPGSVATAVRCVTLGELLAANSVDKYTLVADVEGAEAGIFFTDSAALARCQMMIIELHASTYLGKRVDAGALHRRALELGFQPVAAKRRSVVFRRGVERSQESLADG